MKHLNQYLLLGLIMPAAFQAWAAETEAPKAPPPPAIRMIVPLSLVRGETNQVKIRGINFTNISRLHIDGDNNNPAPLKEPEKSDPPKGTEKDEVGDQMVDAAIIIATTNKVNQVQVSLVSSTGNSKPHPLYLFNKEDLVIEKEPNGAFNKAQLIAPGKIVQGGIEQANDVDLYSFEARKGEKFQLNIMGRVLGSPIDSLLSLYDATRTFLAGNDDTDSRDSMVELEAQNDGLIYIAVGDANDTGSALHLYLLQLSKR